DAIESDTDIAIVEFGANDLRAGATVERMRANLSEIVRSLRARSIEVLLIGWPPLDFSDIASRHKALYTLWDLPAGKYRVAGNHANGVGYGILVAHMLPDVETLVKRVSNK